MPRSGPFAAKSLVMALFTPDGRYLIVRERLWRAANPNLGAAERDRLTRALMAARRAVLAAMRANDADAERTARRRVHRAKVALGERGPVWWQDGAPDLNRRLIGNTPYHDWWLRMETFADAILTLLAERDDDASICPSEVARAVEPESWRSAMRDVRAAARELARQRLIVVTQRGRELDADAHWRGPVRFRQVEPRGGDRD